MTSLLDKRDPFFKWTKSRGGHISPYIDLFHEFPNGRRGIVATYPLKKGELLLLMPVKACIHTLAQEDDEEDDSGFFALKEVLDNLPGTVGPFLRTVLILMHHLAGGKNSCKAPYIQSFPQSHDCTLGWSDSEMKALAGTSIQHTGQVTSGKIFDDHIEPVLHTSGHFQGHDFDSDYDAFEYAAGMVQSRSFHVNMENFITGETLEGEELFMIPGIDMLNHSTRPEDVNTSLQRREETVNRHGDDYEDSVEFTGLFAIEAERDIQAGEEIVISYGNLSDAQLLQTYGFVEEHEGFTNPWNFVSVPSSLVVQAVALVQKGKQKRKRRRAEEEDRFTFKITEAEPLPENLLEYMDELAEEEEVILALLRLADMLLDRYEGTQNLDEELLKSGNVTGRRRLAMLVRVGERRLIRHFKEAVIHMLAADDEEEGEDEDEDEEDETHSDDEDGG